MSAPYQEVLEGATVIRLAPGPRHELICGRLHERLSPVIAKLESTRLLSPRSQVRLFPHTAVCPDVALVTTVTDKLWLAVEVVSSGDHHADTVVKKQIYEELKLPRLWMIDPRYDNVEVYHGTGYGLSLKDILAGRDVLTERLLPDFQMTIAELFAPEPAPS
jgi:Uma2 family endonuclease